MAVDRSKQGRVPALFSSSRHDLIAADKRTNHIRADVKGLPPPQPTEFLGLPSTARPRPALQVDPENPTVDYLKIGVPAAYLRVIENHIRSGVAADHCKWLVQQP
jgi:hypothetical protein